MAYYDAQVDPSAPNNSHSLMLELVGGGKRVLDLGCATGYLAQALTERGNRVSGVEFDPRAAEQARPLVERLVVGDLEAPATLEELAGETFDVLVFGDVLEHLRDPAEVLTRALTLLAPGGSVVVSIPNVGHGSLRLALLQGRWEYRQTGLLDHTHLRFFTRSSLDALLRRAGLVAVDVRPTTVDPLGSEVVVDAGALPADVVDWVRRQPGAYDYQYVLRAVRDDADGAVTAVVSEAARLAQELAAARAEAQEARRRAEAAEAGLAALTGTVTLRLLDRPRRLYAVARRGRGWLAGRRPPG
ncbi:bifunctional 2-polyprenyl-6-hydroxyphenol methylase/3-demethylubiquinol 3-O-methyltransferase UbiG [uncultured Cellulomonas sp.]|uniref:class I SAM-dependent methyltransferase n=1 Tax=uncultured Cellulomonas sp. TaxID=189682 RepID=UPI00260B311A|nr:class I SAM-dependent methyltransferase [uncultured Cellulomonas sp.]